MRIFDGNSHSSTAPFELNGGGRFVLSRKDFVPAYVRTFENGILQERAEEAIKSLRSCRVCPRDCEIDRFNNKIGVCKSGRLARVASAFPHFGEEDCLRGWNGSGTIFFSWCNLRCVFCQNFETSQFGEGAEVGASELAQIMDQYYPAHKAETEPRFTEINRGIAADEFCGALQLARNAGLWRFDTRWRHVIPHGAPVWLPRMRAHRAACVNAS